MHSLQKRSYFLRVSGYKHERGRGARDTGDVRRRRKNIFPRRACFVLHVRSVLACKMREKIAPILGLSTHVRICPGMSVCKETKPVWRHLEVVLTS